MGHLCSDYFSFLSIGLGPKRSFPLLTVFSLEFTRRRGLNTRRHLGRMVERQASGPSIERIAPTKSAIYTAGHGTNDDQSMPRWYSSSG